MGIKSLYLIACPKIPGKLSALPPSSSSSAPHPNTWLDLPTKCQKRQTQATFLVFEQFESLLLLFTCTKINSNFIKKCNVDKIWKEILHLMVGLISGHSEIFLRAHSGYTLHSTVSVLLFTLSPCCLSGCSIAAHRMLVMYLYLYLYLCFIPFVQYTVSAAGAA